MSLTDRLISPSDTKVDFIDPLNVREYFSDQQIKVTLGITGLLLLRVHIDAVIWHLDVDFGYPPGVAARKGWTVRPLKTNMNWVNPVVRQGGFYPLLLKESMVKLFSNTKGLRSAFL